MPGRIRPAVAKAAIGDRSPAELFLLPPGETFQSYLNRAKHARIDQEFHIFLASRLRTAVEHSIVPLDRHQYRRSNANHDARPGNLRRMPPAG